MGQFPQYNWTKFYGNVEEAIPVDMPEPLGKDVDIRMMCDSDHAGDKRTRCSCTAFLIFCNMALIDWVSKKQATIETSVFGAEFVAMKHGIEKLRGLHYKLCMMGIPLTGPSFIYAYNKSQVANSTGESLITHIDSEDNLSDLMAKVAHSGKLCRLVGNIFMTSIMTILSNEARPANPD